MHILHKILLNCLLIGTFIFIIYTFQTTQNLITDGLGVKYEAEKSTAVIGDNKTSLKLLSPLKEAREFEGENDIQEKKEKEQEIVNLKPKSIHIWCIFTKVSPSSPIKKKFHSFLTSLFKYATVNINLNIITDEKSQIIADQIIETCNKNKLDQVKFHQINEISLQIRDIITTLRPHLSSQPGSYYSDALFYVSLGIHRIAFDQERAIMLDIDTRIQCDILELYQQFHKFEERALFGLAPELSPVYRHVLYLYRLKNKGTHFGEAEGFPGFNSGVILLHLDRIRKSQLFAQLLQEESVKQIITKYNFKGHLGDQDWYTLLGMERPELIHQLPCAFNRQLCKWWAAHGYEDVFPRYFRCDQPVKIYHGNCNTSIPV